MRSSIYSGIYTIIQKKYYSVLYTVAVCSFQSILSRLLQNQRRSNDSKGPQDAVVKIQTDYVPKRLWRS